MRITSTNMIMAREKATKSYVGTELEILSDLQCLKTLGNIVPSICIGSLSKIQAFLFKTNDLIFTT